VHAASRALGLSRRGALAAVVAAAVIPTAARLGVSFQPEALTAGLVVFGAACSTRGGSRRLFGGIALGAATLCRYEAWPAAIAFALITLMEGWRARFASNPAGTAEAKPSGTPAFSFSSAVAALTPIAIWMIHGTVAHGSALFFLHRVAAYRAALGDVEPVGSAFFAYPLALVRGEPELVILAGLLLSTAPRASFRDSTFRRPACILGALFVFLVVGRLLGGAPTHHDERPLLSLFWGLAVLAAAFVVDGAPPARSRSQTATGVLPPVATAPNARHRSTLILISSLLLCSMLVRLVRTSDSSFDRRDELSIGAAARRSLRENDRLLVDTPDYGYFAVIAAFGAAERAEPIDRRDPRDAPAPDPFSSLESLTARIAAARANWFVAERRHEPAASRVGAPVADNPSFVLFRVPPPPSGARHD